MAKSTPRMTVCFSWLGNRASTTLTNITVLVIPSKARDLQSLTFLVTTADPITSLLGTMARSAGPPHYAILHGTTNLVVGQLFYEQLWQPFHSPRYWPRLRDSPHRRP